MKSIILCNAGSDSLSKVELTSYCIENIKLTLGEKPIGPSGICFDSDNIYISNSYNSNVSIVDKKSFIEKEQIYFGATPSDLVVLENILFVVCSDSDSVIIYDLKEKEVLLQITTGLQPTKIKLNNNTGKVYVSNIDDETITIIDTKDNYKAINIKVGRCPGAMMFLNSELYVCESNVKGDSPGYIAVYECDTLRLIKRIDVGKCPVDMYEDDGYLYVSNFYDGSISIIDTKKLEVIKMIYIGGMPKGIVVYDKKIFVCDYLNGSIKIIDIKSLKMKAITVGKEPSVMTLI